MFIKSILRFHFSISIRVIRDDKYGYAVFQYHLQELNKVCEHFAPNGARFARSFDHSFGNDSGLANADCGFIRVARKRFGRWDALQGLLFPARRDIV